MKKILHLITDLETGGAEMMLYKLISKMDNKRFSNIVVSLTDKGTLGERIENLGIRVFTLDMRRGIPNPFALIRLIRIIKKEKPDIIQTWLYHADLLGLMLAKLTGIKQLYWNIRCSDMKMERYSFLSRFVLKTCAFFSVYPTAVIANSETGINYHKSIAYKPKRWYLIPNGFDINLFQQDTEKALKLRKELNIKEDDIIIGMVGRNDVMKAPDIFIKVAKIIIDNLSDKYNLRFLMIGRGLEPLSQEIYNNIKELDLEEFVILLGERNDIPALLNTLDIFCLPSRSEGFPNVVGEAMACALPCVVTDVGDAKKIIGNTGKVVPIENPLALAEGIIEFIIMGDKKRLEYGIRARDRIINNYTLETIVKEYEALYEGL